VKGLKLVAVTNGAAENGAVMNELAMNPNTIVSKKIVRAK
jgi:hypothetical protein